MAKKQCQSCRFWSEQVARAIPGQGVFAACLMGFKGTESDGFMRGSESCDEWEGGDPIDDPRREPPMPADEDEPPMTLGGPGGEYLTVHGALTLIDRGVEVGRDEGGSRFIQVGESRKWMHPEVAQLIDRVATIDMEAEIAKLAPSPLTQEEADGIQVIVETLLVALEDLLQANGCADGVLGIPKTGMYWDRAESAVRLARESKVPPPSVNAGLFSALKGCADMMHEAAKQFRAYDDTAHAEMCVLHEDRARAAIEEATR